MKLSIAKFTPNCHSTAKVGRGWAAAQTRHFNVSCLPIPAFRFKISEMLFYLFSISLDIFHLTAENGHLHSLYPCFAKTSVALGNLKGRGKSKGLREI